jgi:ribonuclease HI
VPKQTKWDYEQVTNTLTEACRENGAINIFCNGVVSNKGHADGKQVGATSAMLYQGGKERIHSKQILGKSVTDSDAILCSIHAGLDALTTFLDSDPTQQYKIFTISLASGVAVKRALDISPHEDQEESIGLLKRLGNFLERFPQANVALLWLPRKAPFIGFKRAKQLALEAIRTASLEDIIEPHTIANQKKMAREAAIAAWTETYYLSPHTLLIFRTALTQPPDGKTHHTFQPKHMPNAGPSNAPNDRAGKREAKFSRLTFATFYHIITGHAFIDTYTQHFFSQHTPEQIACPCGEPIQTVEHILLHCPQYTAACRELLTANGRPRTLPQLVENRERVILLLRFIEETGACIKPQASWEPG